MPTTVLTMRRVQAAAMLVLLSASTAACAEDPDALCGRECVALARAIFGSVEAGQVFVESVITHGPIIRQSLECVRNARP